MFEDADLIHRYTRADALEDGTLVDVTETAKGVGFRIPVALTRTAWSDCVAWTEEDNERVVYQDESGRLWDLLWMAINAARRNTEASRLEFKVLRVPRDSRTGQPVSVTLVLDIGPGDQGEAVITIGFAEDF
ncbi:hypothetical protein Thimo_3741 (plasmid) [Thioflavicoccus mobilis 8321]|uniref:Uncharacterized protein n=1 Tax=Thioflavicoccus mobilis 8321 TaxID=765912 RepID=L0H048_9GAMM|nr:DUF6573 family protein [Thioflavicoccus mobilis]AGA92393.1 hypothetical protein Thimo_3741 [Thioflavicoccus mobilis 8321]